MPTSNGPSLSHRAVGRNSRPLPQVPGIGADRACAHLRTCSAARWPSSRPNRRPSSATTAELSTSPTPPTPAGASTPPTKSISASIRRSPSQPDRHGRFAAAARGQSGQCRRPRSVRQGGLSDCRLRVLDARDQQCVQCRAPSRRPGIEPRRRAARPNESNRDHGTERRTCIWAKCKMERFITLCRESAAAADDPEHATELLNMANAIARGIRSRAVPPIKPRHRGSYARMYPKLQSKT
jgi:hypothetical protein